MSSNFNPPAPRSEFLPVKNPSAKQTTFVRPGGLIEKPIGKGRARNNVAKVGGEGGRRGEGEARGRFGSAYNIASRLPSKYRGEVIAGSAARKPRH